MTARCCRGLSVISLLVALYGCAGASTTPPAGLPARSMKGYELYGWREGEGWVFSLLVGTNRIKTKDEITAERFRLDGVQAVKEGLDGLAEGQYVTWSNRFFRDLESPPDAVLKEIETHCKQCGLVPQGFSRPFRRLRA